MFKVSRQTQIKFYIDGPIKILVPPYGKSE